jgi:hypothetical protein
MSVLERLTSQPHRDETLNKQIARELADNQDREGTRELVANLTNPERNIQNDCIGVIEHLSEWQPALVADFVADLLAVLGSRNNRLVWGAMISIAAVADLKPDEIFARKELLFEALKKGSVITVDNAVIALAKVGAAKLDYNPLIFPVLIDHLQHCRAKEIAQHAESIFIAVNSANQADFVSTLARRESELSPSQLARVKKLYKRCK